jgi:DNA-binding LacI/PurR family transcriptional regulator
MLALLGAGDAPTAIVAGNDYTAIRLMELLEEAGHAVPGDVSLVGIDGIDIAGLSRIALTTVAQPKDELASQAVALLLGRIESGYDAPPQQHRLRPALIVRQSTAPPR